MLVELFCDKFFYGSCKENPIRFYSGLNIVRGGDAGDNSIGKSSFLQIVDFAFGGESYEKTDLIRSYGHHTIYFAFEFEGRIFRFGRSTETPRRIMKFTDVYESSEEIAIQEYRNFLLMMYLPDSRANDFRLLTNCFFKFFANQNSPFPDPLRFVSTEKEELGIERFLKLYNAFAPLEKKKIKNEDAKKRKKSYDVAAKSGFLINATMAESKSLTKKINMLEKELQELESGLFSDLKSLKDESLVPVNEKLSDLVCLRSKIKTDWNLLKRNKVGAERKINADYGELQRFFPNIDIRCLEEIDAFHESLKIVLKEEIEESFEKVQRQLALINDSIAQEQKKKESVEKISEATSLLMESFAEKKSLLNQLKRQKSQIDECLQLKKDCKNFKADYNKSLLEITKPLEEAINKTLADMNVFVAGQVGNNPRICIKSSCAYDYGTADDNGSGIKAKDVLLFHLAMLKETSAFVLIHDSFDLKQMQDSFFTNIVKLCEKESLNKQKFLAVDKVSSFSEDSEFIDVVEKRTILKLDSEHKLFT